MKAMATQQVIHRRRRPPISCALCRRRKIRCNRESPCSNCTRSGNAGTCSYEGQAPSRRQQQTHNQRPESAWPQLLTPSNTASAASAASSPPSNSVVTASSGVSSVANQSATGDAESMRNKIDELREQLSASPWPSSAPVTNNANIETWSARFAEDIHFHHDRDLNKQARESRVKCVMHKTRMLGQSHWVNGVASIRDIVGIMEPRSHLDTSIAWWTGIQRCKCLAKVIKTKWRPEWPSPPTRELPVKSVADELVECYLRTFETIYRVLHIPTFRKDYDAMWASIEDTELAFIVQLKLILAIGAVTYDKQFSLRPEAIRWFYEAQCWLSEPTFKSRISIQSLQTNILLMLAREAVGMGEELLWISSGTVLRTAVLMGLHRDPENLPKRSTFVMEMRRRLWNTILELNLQESITSGGPVMMSLEDFDTKQPGNYDDEQLVPENPVPKPENEFTIMSTAITLRRTFPLRLAIAKFLNDISSQGAYERALQLDKEMRGSLKSLRQMLSEWNSSPGQSPTHFEIQVIDFIMHRYLSAIHIPFFSLAWHETTYAHSRKMVIDTSLKLWRAAYPSTAPTAPDLNHSPLDQDDFARLVCCSSGFFRTVAHSAAVLIALELRAQLQEEEGLMPPPLRPDLLAVLDETKTWTMWCLEAGETNAKGYMLISVISAHIEGLMRGLPKDQFPDLLGKAALDGIERCLPILEEKAGVKQSDAIVAEIESFMPNMSQDSMMEDWNFMMPDPIFDFGNLDATSWVFNGENMQEASML